MPTKKTASESTNNAPKSSAPRKRTAAAASDGNLKRKRGESFNEYHDRIWNIVHDSYARAKAERRTA